MVVESPKFAGVLGRLVLAGGLLDEDSLEVPTMMMGTGLVYRSDTTVMVLAQIGTNVAGTAGGAPEMG